VDAHTLATEVVAEVAEEDTEVGTDCVNHLGLPKNAVIKTRG
jgi:hypothetical protein